MQTLILDSSQISATYECPTIWKNRGLVAISETSGEAQLPSEKIAAGSLGHKYLEIYYHNLVSTGGDNGLSARRALALDPDAENKEHFPLDPELRQLVKDRVAMYFAYYPPARDYKPAHKVSTRITPALTSESYRVPLIEQGFSYPLFESNEYLFILEGRIDFVGSVADGSFIWMDHKFQFSAHNLYPKDIQFKNYALATGLNLAVINYIRLHKEIGKTTFVRQPISFSTLEMKYWKQELIEHYVTIAKYVAAEKFPQNWAACKGGFGNPCQYAPLCEEKNTKLREMLQQQKFVARKEWRPW